MDRPATIVGTVITIFFIGFVFVVGLRVGESSVKRDMIQCNRVAQNLDRCYQSIILGEKL
jgi:hypothetical protein